MVADRVRMDAYAEALRRVVKPGAIVLDLGAGLGVFARLACEIGASKVYAVDPDVSILVAKEIASLSRCADVIEFVRHASTKIALPEKADVVVSDLRGVLPLFGRHIPSIIDARRRLLATDGGIIPCRDTLWLSIVDAPDLYIRHVAPWADSQRKEGCEVIGRYLVNTWRRCELTADHLLAPPQCWATLDWTTIEGSDAGATVILNPVRTATVHGLLVWFDTELAEGVRLSNAPEQPPLIYGRAFFPLQSPVPVRPGDQVAVRLHANLVGDDYVWRWSTRVTDGAEDERAAFTQSTFFGEPLDPEQLRKGSDGHVPALNANGQIDSLILTAMRRGLAVSAIAREASEAFPAVYPDWQDALTRVSDLSRKYSK
jgi:type I protein arginine methyltransferase